jgi:hypothetical protein
VPKTAQPGVYTLKTTFASGPLLGNVVHTKSITITK